MATKNKRIKMPKLDSKAPKMIVQGDYGALFNKDDRHIEQRYAVKTKKDKSGKIIMELKPLKDLNIRREEIKERLAEALKDKVDNKELLKDIFDDLGYDNLEQLDTAIDRGAEIKSKEGCYYLQIKDPRRKKPFRLSIRK